jgi:hypothetical protein
MRGNYLAFIRLASNRLWLRVDESAPEISISVPNSTSCSVGTPKSAAERSALRCRKANSDSCHTAGNDLDHLGAVFIRYVREFLDQHVTCTTRWVQYGICLVRGFTGRASRTIDLQPAERMAAQMAA